MSKWPPTSLRGKIHVKHGFPFQGEHFRKSGLYVVLTPGNFHESGGFKRNAEKDKCYSQFFPKEYLLEEGEIVVAMTEQTDGLLGSMAIIPESSKFLHNQRLGLVKSLTPDVDVGFVYHLFKTKSVREQIRRSASGSKVKHTSPDRLYDVIAPLPPPEDQKRIAAFLSALDEKIELNNQINAELEAVAKLLYDYWFVQFDFPMTKAQAASIGRPKLEGKPYRASGGKMVYNRALNREIPEGWRAAKLDEIGQVQGGSTPSTENSQHFCESGIPWITPKDLSNNKGKKFISRGETDVSETGLKAASLKLMPAGTVLLSSRAPIGYLAVASNPVTTNQGFKSFIPNKRFGTDFIHQTLHHFMQLIEQHASGSTFKEISGGVLKAITIPLPECEIAQLYCEKVAPFAAQQKNLETQNRELAQLRDWLLPMLMNGQVTVG